VFEEGGIPGKNTPFHGGFGMINLYDVPKPSMRAFHMLNMLSTTEAATKVVASNSTPGLYTVCSLVKGVNATCVFANTAAVGKPAPPAVTFEKLDTSKLGFAVASVKIARIDVNHSNPHAAWIKVRSSQLCRSTRAPCCSLLLLLTLVSFFPDGLAQLPNAGAADRAEGSGADAVGELEAGRQRGAAAARDDGDRVYDVGTNVITGSLAQSFTARVDRRRRRRLDRRPIVAAPIGRGHRSCITSSVIGHYTELSLFKSASSARAVLVLSAVETCDCIDEDDIASASGAGATATFAHASAAAGGIAPARSTLQAV